MLLNNFMHIFLIPSFLFAAADVILWREKYISAGILISSTLAWILLEHSGYTLLSIISNVLLLLILTFFVWANAANFIHK